LRKTTIGPVTVAVLNDVSHQFSGSEFQFGNCPCCSCRAIRVLTAHDANGSTDIAQILQVGSQMQCLCSASGNFNMIQGSAPDRRQVTESVSSCTVFGIVVCDTAIVFPAELFRATIVVAGVSEPHANAVTYRFKNFSVLYRS